MSSQINFYLSDLDHQNLVRELTKVAGISYVLPPLTTADLEPHDLSVLGPWKSGENSPLLFLRHQTLSFQLVPSGPNRFSYYIDVAENPVVEYLRAVQREHEIQRGRFYYTSRYLAEDGYIHEKPSEFIQFAKRIFMIAKKFCSARYEGFYIGPDAAILQRKGLKLPLNG
jgi:hypothetical protein